MRIPESVATIAVSERAYTRERLIHRHPYAQAVLPAVGHLQLEIAGERGQVGDGGLAVVAPGVEHLSWADDPARCLVVDLAPALLAEVELEAGGTVAPGGAGAPFRPLDARLTALDRVLRVEAASGGLADRLIAESLGRYTARLLLPGQEPAAPTRAGGVAGRRLARRVCEVVESRLTDDLSLTEIATATGASVAHLQRAFKRELGTTVVGYIHRRRLALAADLLRTTELSVTEVALAAGFANPSYFARLFARATGRSPSRYRAERRD